jgi:error-prone DNA polymerase
VPIFQEQVMKLIEVVAGFTPGEGDELRRAMAAWKRRGGLERFHDKIQSGMLARGYEQAYFERVFEQIKGFGEYGFPESHSASFAVLAFASSWLKKYHPAAFTCSLLNSQPMGFYQPSQLIQDAQRHGVAVLPVDVTVSEWDCTLEPLDPKPQRPPMRTAAGPGCLAARHPADPWTFRRRRHASRRRAERYAFCGCRRHDARARISAPERASLADAGALQSLSGHRYRARWDSAGAELPAPVLANAAIRERRVALRKPSLREDVMTDYATQGLSLTHHPLSAGAHRACKTTRVAREHHAGCEQPRQGAALRGPGHRAPASGHGQRRHVRHARG